MCVLRDFLLCSCLFGSFVTCFGVLSIFISSRREKLTKQISCNIVINQQVSSPDPDRVITEAKIKHPKYVEGAQKGQGCLI